MKANTDYGTAHVGVRRFGAAAWQTPGKTWETFDRITDAPIGPEHRTLGDAIAYAEYREQATYGPSSLCDLHGATCPR